MFFPGFPNEIFRPREDAADTSQRVVTGNTISDLAGSSSTSARAIITGYAPVSRTLRLWHSSAAALVEVRVSLALSRDAPEALTLLAVPSWGITVPVPAGLCTVSGWAVGGAVGESLSAALAPGYVAEYVIAQELGAAFGPTAITPPAWAQWVEVSSTAGTTVNGVAVPAGQPLKLAAQTLTVATAAAPNTASLLWHCYH